MTNTLSTLADRAAEQLSEPDTWFGLSGHRVTGEAVAHHLEAAARLMERENWDPQLYAPFTGHHLSDALTSTAKDGQGDTDTRFIARKVMETLLQVVMGAPYVDYEIWSQHSTRTLEEIVTLCRTAARIARRVGPVQPGTEHPPLP